MSKLSPWSEWLDVCLLRRPPQDVPHSPRLTRDMVILSVVIDAVLALMAGRDSSPALVLLSLMFLLLLPWLFLNAAGRLQRYPQTLAALAGTGVLFGLALMPAVLAWNEAGPLEPGDVPNAVHVAAYFLQLGLNAWRLLVVAHILRHAMEVRLFAASLFALGWFILELSASVWLFSSTQ